MIAGTLAIFSAILAGAGLSPTSRLRPAILHNLAWALGLTIVATGLLSYRAISPFAWLLIASSVLLVNAGVACVRRPATLESGWGQVAPTEIRLWHFKLLVVLFAFGVFVYLRTVDDLFGIRTLLSDPTSIRGSTDINYLEEFPRYGKLCFYLGPLVSVLLLFPQFVDRLDTKIWRLPLLVAVSAAQLMTLQRTNLFVSLVWIIGLLVMGAEPQWRATRARRGRAARRADVTSRRTVIAAIVMAIVGIAAFQGLATALGKTGENAAFTQTVDQRVRYSAWVSPMFYASSGIPAFSQLVDSQNTDYPPQKAVVYGDYNPHTWGAATLSGPSRVLPGVRSWNEVAPFTKVPQPTNVYTWLEPWYRDFRAYGVLLGSLAMGLLLGTAARRADGSLGWTLAAGLIIGQSFLATFVNRYGMVMSVLLYIALMLLTLSNPARRVKADSAGLRASR